jgi:hypothetical protein
MWLQHYPDTFTILNATNLFVEQSTIEWRVYDASCALIAENKIKLLWLYITNPFKK